MIDFDHCAFCQGDLHLADASQTEGWVFVCSECGRETILSDTAMGVLLETV